MFFTYPVITRNYRQFIEQICHRWPKKKKEKIPSNSKPHVLSFDYLPLKVCSTHRSFDFVFFMSFFLPSYVCFATSNLIENISVLNSLRFTPKLLFFSFLSAHRIPNLNSIIVKCDWALVYVNRQITSELVELVWKKFFQLNCAVHMDG